MKQTYFKTQKNIGLKLKSFSCIALIMAVGLFNINAQESLNTTGGDISNFNGSVNYSVGQVFYSTITTGNGSVSQGVQYAFNLKTLTGNSFRVQLDVMVFPNPTTSQVNLKTKMTNVNALRYELYDVMGRKIMEKTITNETTIINMEALDIATYQLNVVGANYELLKSFKIIKN
ncbi:putative secreted protein (Por secretion system target) [Jejuia pallidilutea]|uniref:Putative secreted protein (Por secretion system target) n=1 Tax=Jejuia pallidilutea TaxID=504487 RepID=A0A362X6A2_9FLAO|nr:T9SS type A sorting domain-containing protein [Jejuia pallidilutea]PQV50541.1 putative secreted protein (Por secretion system target) [Jejuia pallidilutea]